MYPSHGKPVLYNTCRFWWTLKRNNGNNKWAIKTILIYFKPFICGLTSTVGDCVLTSPMVGDMILTCFPTLRLPELCAYLCLLLLSKSFVYEVCLLCCFTFFWTKNRWFVLSGSQQRSEIWCSFFQFAVSTTWLLSERSSLHQNEARLAQPGWELADAVATLLWLPCCLFWPMTERGEVYDMSTV